MKLTGLSSLPDFKFGLFQTQFFFEKTDGTWFFEDYGYYIIPNKNMFVLIAHFYIQQWFE